MSKAELSATLETGLLRGGRPGTHFVSNSISSRASKARQRLALPQAPELRVTIQVPSGKFSSATRVDPAFNLPGGGLERSATGEIPVKILRVDEF
jgi:hypothetical protein